jgi:hypothetical protein
MSFLTGVFQSIMKKRDPLLIEEAGITLFCFEDFKILKSLSRLQLLVIL